MSDTNPINWDTLRRDLEGQAAYYIAMHTTPEKAREIAWCIVNAVLPAGYEPRMVSPPVRALDPPRELGEKLLGLKDVSATFTGTFDPASVRSELVAHEGMRLEVKLDVTDPAVLTEQGIRMSGGGMHVFPRLDVADEVARALVNGGQQVLRRRVLVVEDWTEVTAENGDSE